MTLSFDRQPMRLMIAVAAFATRIEKEPISTEGTPPRARLVGGFVRDTILGIPSKDADIEVYGVPQERIEEIAEELFPGRTNHVGHTFGILKVHLDHEHDLDIALPRTESKTGVGHRDFVIHGNPFLPIDEAARRRDFTINAMLADPLTGELTDPYHGAKDLDERILRVVDPATFPEDPLRVYRALQFVARFNLTVDPATHELMCRMVSRGDLDHLTVERITSEWKKLLFAPTPSLGLTLARDLGVIERYTPELHALIGVEQEKKWHPEGDVWTHTLLVVDQTARLLRSSAHVFSDSERRIIMLGALCHDVGKPETTQEIDGRIRSLGHEAAGENAARSFCHRFAIASAEIEAVVSIVTEHLTPRRLANEYESGQLNDSGYVNAVRRFLRRISPLSWRTLLIVAEADARGRTLPGCTTDPFTPGDLMTSFIQTHQIDIQAKTPLLRGEDLLAHGIPPGPALGKMLERIEQERDNGRLTTAEDAIAFLQRTSKT